MSRLGFWEVVFKHVNSDTGVTEDDVELIIRIEVGDGEHPPYARAVEELKRRGLSLRHWEFWADRRI